MLNLEQIHPVFIELACVIFLFSYGLEWNLVVMSLERVCKLSYVEEAHQEDFLRICEQIL
jgi:hypothetical protein